MKKIKFLTYKEAFKEAKDRKLIRRASWNPEDYLSMVDGNALINDCGYEHKPTEDDCLATDWISFDEGKPLGIKDILKPLLEREDISPERKTEILSRFDSEQLADYILNNV